MSDLCPQVGLGSLEGLAPSPNPSCSPRAVTSFTARLEEMGTRAGPGLSSGSRRDHWRSRSWSLLFLVIGLSRALALEVQDWALMWEHPTPRCSPLPKATATWRIFSSRTCASWGQLTLSFLRLILG